VPVVVLSAGDKRVTTVATDEGVIDDGNNPKTTPPLTGCVMLRLLHGSPMPIGAACAQWSSSVETNWN